MVGRLMNEWIKPVVRVDLAEALRLFGKVLQAGLIIEMKGRTKSNAAKLTLNRLS